MHTHLKIKPNNWVRRFQGMLKATKTIKPYIHGQPIKGFVQLLSKLEMMQDLFIFFYSHLEKPRRYLPQVTISRRVATHPGRTI